MTWIDTELRGRTIHSASLRKGLLTINFLDGTRLEASVAGAPILAGRSVERPQPKSAPKPF